MHYIRLHILHLFGSVEVQFGQNKNKQYSYNYFVTFYFEIATIVYDVVVGGGGLLKPLPLES